MKTKRRYKKTPIKIKIMITVLVIAVVLAVAAIVATAVYICSDKDTDTATKDMSPTYSSESTKDEITESREETQVQTQPETEETVSTEEQPEELTYLLALQGQGYEALRNSDCDQLVTVTADSTNATINFYSCVDGLWVKDDSLSCHGFVGQQGTVEQMSEDISGTPKGFYSIGSAFYRNNIPETKLDVFAITQDTYWVDDPDSKFYNQRVEGTSNKDWDSAEHMIDYSNYDYGFVINYNMPAQYNAGSAIFFHVGYAPTAGCVAVSEDMVLQYLKNLDIEKNPYILIN